MPSITVHASISSRNTEVHLLPNKSQSTAFLLYTSRHLACNLPVCRGDLWPSNDPNRRRACNCWGWRNDSNDSLFQYLFIHTLWNERDLEEHSAFDWTLAGWGDIQGWVWAWLISKAISTELQASYCIYQSSWALHLDKIRLFNGNIFVEESNISVWHLNSSHAYVRKMRISDFPRLDFVKFQLKLQLFNISIICHS